MLSTMDKSHLLGGETRGRKTAFPQPGEVLNETFGLDTKWIFIRVVITQTLKELKNRGTKCSPSFSYNL